MQHHDSDHPVLVLWVKTDPTGVKHYMKERHTYPPPLLLPSLLTYGKSVFQEPTNVVEKPPVKERLENTWVRGQESRLWMTGALTQRESRRLARAIKASLKLDMHEQAHKAGESTVLELKTRNIKEAWGILKAWQREAGDTATEPCHASM